MEERSKEMFMHGGCKPKCERKCVGEFAEKFKVYEVCCREVVKVCSACGSEYEMHLHHMCPRCGHMGHRGYGHMGHSGYGHMGHSGYGHMEHSGYGHMEHSGYGHMECGGYGHMGYGRNPRSR